MSNPNFQTTEAVQRWASFIFQGGDEVRRGSLYANQNLKRPPRFEYCHVRLWYNNTWVTVEGHHDITIKFFIQGGCMAPRLLLRLTKGKAEDPEVEMSAWFLPWSHCDTDTARPTIASFSREIPQSGIFTFSSRLHGLRWCDADIADDRRALYEPLLGKKDAAEVTWHCSPPICWGFEQDISTLSSEVQLTINNFKLLAHGGRVRLLFKKEKKLIERYNYFVAQPVPTPPHWWPYAARQVINHHAVDEIPPLSSGTLLALHRKREKGWVRNPPGFVEPVRADHMDPPVRYLDERQYEVFMQGVLMREVQWEAQTREASRMTDSLGCIHNRSIARFQLGLHGTLFRDVQRCIRDVMYGGTEIDPDNWLKNVLLAHDAITHPINLPTYPEASHYLRNYIHEMDEYLLGVDGNDQQMKAIRSCLVFGPQLYDKINMIQGPPGSGKTWTICQIVVFYIMNHIPIVVSAGTAVALNINCVRLLEKLDAFDLSTNGIYRLLPDVYEEILTRPDFQDTLDEDVNLDFQDHVAHGTGLLTTRQSDMYQPDLSARLVAILETYLRRQVSNDSLLDRLSLPKHILGRLERFKEVIGHDRVPYSLDERKELWLLHTLAEALDAAQQGGTVVKINTRGEKEVHYSAKVFGGIWLDVQKYYLSDKRCRGIFVTTPLAGTRAMLAMQAKVVIIDEISQIKECEALNAIVPRLTEGKLEKVVLVGDPKQLPPTVLSYLVSEFGEVARLDLLSRLLAAGNDCTLLDVQYRMHPNIARIVNHLHYGGKLQDDPSTLNRPSAQLFRTFCRNMHLCPTSQAIFINIDIPEEDTILYNEGDKHSRINPSYIHHVYYLVNAMIAFGISGRDILVITWYAAQRHCYERLFRHYNLNIEVRTVDGAQAYERPFVILDNVTPGGRKYTLGFLKDVRRMNVALSRAQDGLFVVGAKNMAAYNSNSQPVKDWKWLIHHLGTQGAVSDLNIPGNTVCQTLNIPGAAYTVHRPRKGYVGR